MTGFIRRNIKTVIFISCAFLCNLFPAHSQVVIGLNTTPLRGTLLDLEETQTIDGNDNSTKGMMLPRVFLTSMDSLMPILTGSESNYDALKPTYTGLVVYNVNPAFPKGLYTWDGMQWNMALTSALSSIKARNGLTALGIDTVVLGGDLVKNTIINLGDSNLIFNRGQGKIGIGTDSLQAILHVANPDSIDPLILQNVKFVTDASNVLDTRDTTYYYDLKISEKGVVRKIQQSTASLNQSFGYDLTDSTLIAPGNDALLGALGGGGSTLSWTPSAGGSDSPYITLPEDGAYVFSFNLYGNYALGTGTPTGSDVNSFYISAFKNNDGSNITTTPPVDIAEIVVMHTPLQYTNWTALSYSINLTVMGKAKDQILFKISSFSQRSGNFSWTLAPGLTNSTGGKTSMVYWRL